MPTPQNNICNNANWVLTSPTPWKQHHRDEGPYQIRDQSFGSDGSADDSDVVFVRNDMSIFDSILSGSCSIMSLFGSHSISTYNSTNCFRIEESSLSSTSSFYAGGGDRECAGSSVADDGSSSDVGMAVLFDGDAVPVCDIDSGGDGDDKIGFLMSDNRLDLSGSSCVMNV